MKQFHKCPHCNRMGQADLFSLELNCGRCGRSSSLAAKYLAKPDDTGDAKNSEINELAKEIFMLLTKDLVGSGEYFRMTVSELDGITRANAETSFRHARAFVAQKYKLPPDTQ